MEEEKPVIIQEDQTESNFHKSPVWQLFKTIETVDGKKDECTVCKKKLTHTESTSSKRYHLEKKHFSEYSKLLNDNKSESQLQLTKDFNFKKLSKLKSEEISNAILEFIVIDSRPYNTVNGKGFQKLIELLCPSYEMPSRQTFSDRLISEKYQQYKSKLIANIVEDKPQSINITTDYWSSLSNKSFLTVNIHYLNDNFEIQKYVLDTVEVQEQHTSNITAKKILEQIEEYGLLSENNSLINKELIPYLTATSDKGKIMSKNLDNRLDQPTFFKNTLQKLIQKLRNLKLIYQLDSERISGLINKYNPQNRMVDENFEQQFQISYKTCAKIFNRFKNELSYQDLRENNGKEPIYNQEEQENIVQRVEENIGLNLKDIAQNEDINSREASMSTMRRILINNEIKCYKQPKKIILSQQNKDDRFSFAKQTSSWSKNWQRVLFTDECQLCMNPENKFFYTSQQENIPPSLFKEQKQYPIKAHVWGCISYKGPLKLLEEDGIITIEDKITESELQSLKDLNAFLLPFYNMTQIMQNSKAITCSLILPICYNIYHNILKSNQPTQNKVITELQQFLKLKFEKKLTSYRYHEESTKKILLFCSFLDPKFKHLYFATNEEIQQTHEAMRQIFCELKAHQQDHKQQNVMIASGKESKNKNQSEKTQQKQQFSMSVFGFMPEQQKIKEVEINELDQYIKLNPIDMEQDSLVWWKNNSFQYPILSQISKTVLNIQGTSSESERLFSKAGIILNKQRGMLSDSNPFFRIGLLTKSFVPDCIAASTSSYQYMQQQQVDTKQAYLYPQKQFLELCSSFFSIETVPPQQLKSHQIINETLSIFMQNSEYNYLQLFDTTNLRCRVSKRFAVYGMPVILKFYSSNLIKYSGGMEEYILFQNTYNKQLTGISSESMKLLQSN
ncbi:hypothetical protein ABPG72_021783 [Tetrahymena utriculariae]